MSCGCGPEGREASRQRMRAAQRSGGAAARRIPELLPGVERESLVASTSKAIESAEEVVAIIEGALEAKRGQIDALRFMMGEE